MEKDQLPLKEFLLERKKKNGYLCIPYLILGYPNWKKCYEIACQLLKNGADTIELGIPFTDPVADGPIIQSAFQEVLKKKFTLQDVFQFVQKIRKKFPSIPFPVMGYSNFFYSQGNYKKMFSQFRQSNIYDYIIPDIPYEEQENAFAGQKNIHFVNFITLNTSIDRTKKIVQNSNGFIYAVSIRGITGARKNFDIRFYKDRIPMIRQHTSTPVLIGFGISSKAHAQMAVSYADGFIVGSYFIKAIQDKCDANQIAGMLKNILP